MLIKSPQPLPESFAELIFLAGGISNCADWQSEIAELIDTGFYDVANPRRDEGLSKTGSEAIRQIKWEYDALAACDHALFWFPDTSICPITLFEYGKMLERARDHQLETLVCGVAEDYERAFDLDVQTGLVADHVDHVHFVRGWGPFKNKVAQLFGPSDHGRA